MAPGSTRGAPTDPVAFIDPTSPVHAKARWALETLLSAAGCPSAITDKADLASQAWLAYGADPVPGVPTIPASSQAADVLLNKRPLPANTFAQQRVAKSSLHAAQQDEALSGPLIGAFPVGDEGFAIPFDMLASAFVLLACWDEYTQQERDAHGRLPFSASVFATNQALRPEEPACDAYAAWLRSVFLRHPSHPVSATDCRHLTVALTHDVDSWGEWTPRNWAGWVRRLGTAAAGHGSTPLGLGLSEGAAHAAHDLLRARPLPIEISRIIELEAARHCASTFFVLVGHEHPTDGPGHLPRPATLAAIRSAGHEVALHGAHVDAHDPEQLSAHLAVTQAGAAASPAGPGAGLATEPGIRYHYLKCSYHDTLPMVARAGFAYDSSLAFAEHEGFRCGTAHPFHPYDIAADRPLALVELPLVVMDTTLFQRSYRGLGVEAAADAARRCLAAARRSGGTVAILWHPNRFRAHGDTDHERVYLDLINWILCGGGTCTTAAAAVATWTQQSAPRGQGDASGVTTASATVGAEAGLAVPDGRLRGDTGSSPKKPSALASRRPRIIGRVTESGRRAARSPYLRVAHVSVVHRPDDPRIFERECRTLADAGHEVTYIVPGANERQRDGVRLAALPVRPRSTRWLNAGPVLRHLHALRPSVIHVHDPELLTLFPILRMLGPRLVYDMHEYVTQAVAGKHYIPPSLRGPAAGAVELTQRSLVALADGVVSVVPEQFEELGARPALRTTLPNYPRYSRFHDARPLPEIASDERLKLIYIGSLTHERGVDLMLDVIDEAPDEVALYLGGVFYDARVEARVQARTSQGSRPRVHLLGRIPPDSVPRYLASADVVWVPSLRTSQYQRPAVATKLFEGMACGLAALVSDLPGRRAVVEGAGCGLAVPPTVAGHLEGVRRLLSDRQSVAAMGQRGGEAVRTEYSWEAIEHRLVDFYADLTAPRQR